MNCSKRMKKKIKQITYWIFIGFCFGITPYMFYLADLERGYNATGGEIFIPLIPIIFLLVNKEERKDKEND